MSLIEPVIKKIPGEIPPQPKKSSQGYIDDLSKKQKFELLEILERQNKLLAKKSIRNLKDGGEKIRNIRDKLLKELERRDKIDEAAKLLSKLNIADEGKAAMNELEWTGNYSEHSKMDQEKIVELDSDDEEDALKILSQPTGAGVHKKKVIHLGPEESLITPKDLEEIESFKTVNPVDIGHVKYIVHKVENPENEKRREPYKPYKTTKSNVHDPEREKEREVRKNKHWEVTAATPPLIVHGAAKVLDLNESLRLQTEQAVKLQEIQAKHAAERLTQQLGLYRVGGLQRNAGNYREKNKHSSDSSSSEDEDYPEVHDDDDQDKGGTVVFTVDSIES